jgi:hypothetical protein
MEIQKILDEFAVSRFGKTKNYGHMCRMRYVYLYNADGKFAMKFQCVSDLCEALKIKHFNPNKGYYTVAGYIVKYFYTEQLTPQQINESISKSHSWSRRGKPVNQFDLNGNLIKTWPTISEASKGLGINPTNISIAVKKETRSASGFKWKWYE